MLAVWNRIKLITLVSQRKYFRVKEALSAAGIAHCTRIHGMLSFDGRDRWMIPGMNRDAMGTYTIYVHRDDQHRALQAVEQALRDQI